MSSQHIVSYDTWSFICRAIVHNNIEKFKELGEVKEMLEHVSVEHGREYLEDLLKEGISIDLIEEVSELNDTNGAEIINYHGISVSPSTLRYLRHAVDISNLIESKKFNGAVNLVEVGGGYGALCLILNFILEKQGIEVNNYHIIDLEPVSNLQKHYLKGKLENAYFHDSSNFGADVEEDNLILISNYCLGEIAIDTRKKYLEILLPKMMLKMPKRISNVRI